LTSAACASILLAVVLLMWSPGESRRGAGGSGAGLRP
jgi:hypothetical protein